MKLIFAILAIAASSTVCAQQADVTFFVIGKHANFHQDSTGELHAVDFSFFSEIFMTDDGNASDGVLVFPTGEQIDFVDKRQATNASRDNILLISGADRFGSYSDLQNRYPDGRYEISFNTPSGDVVDGPLQFVTRGLPDAPRIHLTQNGNATNTTILAGKDLKITWSRFRQGGADNNDILDDLIFVILEDNEGKRVAHSGRPFENKPYLTYADLEFVIDGEIFAAGQTYNLSVEHAILDDTREFAGVPSMTTRAVTTKLELSANQQ